MAVLLLKNVTTRVVQFQNQLEEFAVNTFDALTSSLNTLDDAYFTDTILSLELPWKECDIYYRAINDFYRNTRGYEICEEIATNNINDILHYIDFELTLSVEGLNMLYEEYIECNGLEFCEDVINELIDDEILTINAKMLKFANYVKEMFDEIEKETFSCLLIIENTFQLLIDDYEYCKEFFF